MSTSCDESWRVSNELRLMKHCWKSFTWEEKYKCLQQPLQSPDPNVATDGVMGITQRYSGYQNLDEFLVDIDSLVRSYSTVFANDRKVKRAAADLSEICHRDARHIRNCAECYQSWVHDPLCYFKKVCSKPHLIVFAKVEGFPYWPAKVMAIRGDTVNVSFFGDHSQFDISVDNCFLYADRLPGRKTKSGEFKEAVAELEDHIEEIKKKFGSFVSAGYRTPLIPQMAEKQVMKMIPGAFGNRSQADVHEVDDALVEAHQNHDDLNETSEDQPEPIPPKRVRYDDNVETSQNHVQPNLPCSTSNQNWPQRARKTFPGMVPRRNIHPVNRGPAEIDMEAMTRKINESEEVRIRNREQIRQYEYEIQQLKDLLEKKRKCAACGQCLDDPIFCSQKCQLNFD